MIDISSYRKLAVSRADERRDRSASQVLRELQEASRRRQQELGSVRNDGPIIRGLRNVRMLGLAIISSGFLATAIPYAFPPMTSSDKQCEIAEKVLVMGSDGKLDAQKDKALIDDAKRELMEDCMR
jgi:hypothetical protein